MLLLYNPHNPNPNLITIFIFIFIFVITSFINQITKSACSRSARLTTNQFMIESYRSQLHGTLGLVFRFRSRVNMATHASCSATFSCEL
ncbi:hypothetical protein Hanom_Chr07g00653671 [Helianthus anomalus]